MKTVIWFQMQKGGELMRVVFRGKPSDAYIDNWFDTKCGGVYKWWREDDCNVSEVDLY